MAKITEHEFNRDSRKGKYFCVKCNKWQKRELFIIVTGYITDKCAECRNVKSKKNKDSEEDGSYYCNLLAENTEDKYNYQHYPNTWSDTYKITL